MAKIVLAYAGQTQNAFLRRAFQVERLHKLRIGRCTYAQLLEQLASLQSARRIFCDSIFPQGNALGADVRTRLAQAGVEPSPKDVIICLNMAWYPIDMAWVEHLLEKASSTDIPLKICTKETSSPQVAIVSAHYDLLTRIEADVEWGFVHAEKHQLADLTHPPTALRLFSSNFSLRHFNSLQVSRGIYFLKLSSDTAKMRAEYEFYRQAPSSVRPYFPQVGDMVTQETQTGYEIEIIPQIDVAKALFNGLFARKEHCFSLIQQLTNYVMACPRKKVDRDVYQHCSHQIFVEKTRSRVQQSLKLPQLDVMDTLCHLQGWTNFATFAEYALHCLEEAIAHDNANELVFSHGDLFFANMIFDPVTEKLKLIDPRGIRTDEEHSGYLPAWYDLAKLSHSILGHYDLMVYGMMDIVMQTDLHLGLRSEDVPGLSFLANYFSEMLDSLQVSKANLRLYEGSLFLSMIPLHREDTLRMQRQLLRAIELFSAK